MSKVAGLADQRSSESPSARSVKRHIVSRRRAIGVLLLGVLAPATCLAQSQPDATITPIDGGPYVPTPSPVVDMMLHLARVGPEDLVYDLGSGDGRLVIEAARRYGARGVGVELNAELVERARADAAAAGVADRVQFVRGDLLRVDLRPATIVTLYLLPAILVHLAPKLRAELPAGARVVAHDFSLDGWTAEDTLEFESEEKARVLGSGLTRLFLYRAPGPAPHKDASIRRY